MKNRMSKKTIGLTATALVLIAGLSVGNALAYFTTYTTASGGMEIDLGFTDTELDDEVYDGAKHIAVTNTGDYDCYVRIRALAGDAYINHLNYILDGEGKWYDGEDGYYYYSDILAPGTTTNELVIQINNLANPPAEGEAAEFNVIIVQEYTPVMYDKENDGAPYADWDAEVEVGKSSEAEVGEE